MDGPHRGIDQENFRKINEYANGTPEHETTGAATNQKENPRYRPIGKVQDQCSFLYYRGPMYNAKRKKILRLMRTLPNQIQQRQ